MLFIITFSLVKIKIFAKLSPNSSFSWAELAKPMGHPDKPMGRTDKPMGRTDKQMGRTDNLMRRLPRKVFFQHVSTGQEKYKLFRRSKEMTGQFN